MLHHHHHHHPISLSSVSAMPAPPQFHQKPRKPSSTNPNPNSSILCKHSPSATLDILILMLVLFSGSFLLTSYFSYIFQSLSQIIPSSFFLSYFDSQSPFTLILGFLVFLIGSLISLKICCNYRSRKCKKPGCKGLKDVMEFDLQLQTEDNLKSLLPDEFDNLPLKGGTEDNPDYEYLRSELRKMAPPNGRAVLLFRARCGCPLSKLVAWAPKRSRRHKKALSNLVLDEGKGE